MKNKQGTILIIEDDAEFLETLVDYLSELDIQITTANDGKIGTHFAVNSTFDCILCDITMPEMRGDEAVEKIRETPLNGRTPIIILSAYLDNEIVAKLSDKTARIFSKPINFELLGKTVIEQIKKYRENLK
jgi:CheY-like chemotaxis protein